jgi:sucrose-6F-phosphate phosphohydrolase
MKTILLCSDLDRTLIPNGAQPESLGARAALRHLATRPQLRLAYVSGRDKKLVEEAMAEFALPEPDFVIGDVGTTLYRIDQGRWWLDNAWQQEIGRDWGDHNHKDLTAMLGGIDTQGLRMQPPEKQNRYKVSYYTDADIDPQPLKQMIAKRLEAQGIATHIIWSRDEATQRGLLDLLPRRANKLEAIRFLMAAEATDESHTVFAGDSGNDLDALSSGLQAILVANAAEDVQKAALEGLTRQNLEKRLYLAKGGFLGLNGNYAAGVLEGLAHFFPETVDWIAAALRAVQNHPDSFKKFSG